MRALTRERAQRQWSLRTAAEKADVSVGVWQRIEAGKEVEYRSLLKVAQSVGINAELVDELQAGRTIWLEDLASGTRGVLGPDDVGAPPSELDRLRAQVARLERRVNDLEIEQELHHPKPVPASAPSRQRSGVTELRRQYRDGPRAGQAEYEPQAAEHGSDPGDIEPADETRPSPP